MKDSPGVFVLDSYAILALLGREAGHARVNQILRDAKKGKVQAVMSVINLGEVAYIIERQLGFSHVHETLAVIAQLPIEKLSVDHGLVLEAAHIKANYPLSYADAFCAAVGLRMGGTILTGDPEFESIAKLLPVEKMEPN